MAGAWTKTHSPAGVSELSYDEAMALGLEAATNLIYWYDVLPWRDVPWTTGAADALER
ncbi:MAG: hypothetical protein JXE06_03265 [Coriobacteriia bacterium]|nr:hypothetical protein [Coriobacteriia bacterium]